MHNTGVIMNLSLFDQIEMLALIRFDMGAKNYNFALEKIKYSFSQSDIPVEIFALAGKTYASLNLFEKAKDNFESYLKQVPDAYIELFQLGMVERDLGNNSASIEIWKSVLDIQENYPDALFYLGETCVTLNKIEEAREWLFKLLETAPDNSQYINLADQLLNSIKAH
jgi:tetratricopeptide (TPR) repeat protein